MRIVSCIHRLIAGAIVTASLGAQAAPPLQTYNIIPGTASVMGFSTGAFMAAQQGVAYSGMFPAGIGVIAGGPFDCARDEFEEVCMSNNTPDITQPVANMQAWSGNLIDPVTNLARMKIYLWTGTDDGTVGPNIMGKVNQQMLAFAPASAVRYDVIQGAGHVFQYGGQDGTTNTLSWLYGALNPPSGTLTGQLVPFDQSAFNSSDNGMDPMGFVYVPAACANGAPCRLVVYFHGCFGNYNQAVSGYFQNFGMNHYADTNNFIILYPQTLADQNPRTDLHEGFNNWEGCWDYRGVFGAKTDFDQHTGAEVASVNAMVQKIMGASAVSPQPGLWWNPSEPGRGYSIEVSPTDGQLFISAYMYDAAGNPIWYSAMLTPTNGPTYQGVMVEYGGGQTLGGPYQAPSQQIGVANVSIQFTTPTTAVMVTAPPGGNTTSVNLQRYQFAANGLNAPSTVTQAQTGWWWNPAQPGSGWFLEVQNNTMLIAGYLYGGNGSPFWYVGQNALSSDTSFSGTFTQYGDGQTLGGAYQSASLTNPSVANVSITFTAPDTGMLNVQNGPSIPIQRYHF